MKKFDIFVLPFTIGLAFILAYTVIMYVRWIAGLSPIDKLKLRANFIKTLPRSLKEIVMESLFHRKIYKKNFLLGYMHMSFAFGWLMLIVIGNIQSHLYSRDIINPPYYPIFYKFFEPYPMPFATYKVFEFIMDFLLLYILSGVFLAYIKRIRSRLLGMQSTTRHIFADRMTLTSLWLIFPLRLLAESFTSHHRGEFLTGTLYRFFSGFLPVHHMAYPFWWAYSIALGVFFLSLPLSRYMHIITEPLLIILRNAGIKTYKEFKTYTDVELNACSRCGICIDACQMSTAARIRTVQPVYFLRDARYRRLTPSLANHCLLCGRCNEACPVGIDQVALRIIKRKDFTLSPAYYEYIPSRQITRAPVLYFAGCMTHLTPSIIIAMKEIFARAGEKVWWMDENGSICCGRPLIFSGNIESARVLMKKNKDLIEQSGASLLVTSCPICYRTFREDYHLRIPVMHHTQYIYQLIKEGKLKAEKTSISTVYHDPCELGRGCGIYDEPREVLKQYATLVSSPSERNNALCCGGSLGNSEIPHERREMITRDATLQLLSTGADYLVTSCPLCKKTFSRFSPAVIDIAQVVAGQWNSLPPAQRKNELAGTMVEQ